MKTLLTILLLFAVRPAQAEPAGADCARVVSLAPSLTETLYALGLGERVAGVTNFCHYPPEVNAKPKIGGLYDVNLEALMRVSPSLAFLLDDSRFQEEELQKLGIRSQIVSHRTLAGLLQSIDLIAERCGIAERGRRLKGEIEAAVAETRRKTAQAPRLRVLLVVGRSGTGSVARNVFVSGRDGFYSDLLEAAGGRNVYDGVTGGMSALSPEALVLLQPDMIIEVIHDFAERGWSLDDIRRSWAPLDYLPAVQNGRIYVLSGDYAVIPGPRVIRLLQDLARIVHPELFS